MTRGVFFKNQNTIIHKYDVGLGKFFSLKLTKNRVQKANYLCLTNV